jgi:hypothetical protein
MPPENMMLAPLTLMTTVELTGALTCRLVVAARMLDVMLNTLSWGSVPASVRVPKEKLASPLAGNVAR